MGLLLHPPKSDDKMKKVGQSCIRKEVNSYKIHTLRACCPNIYTVEKKDLLASFHQSLQSFSA
jgi:hypothetical protein